jgi:hypothetical protein
VTAFAMTAGVPAHLVVLDEPTNDVDPVRRHLLWEQIRILADDGAAGGSDLSQLSRRPDSVTARTTERRTSIGCGDIREIPPVHPELRAIQGNRLPNSRGRAEASESRQLEHEAPRLRGLGLPGIKNQDPPRGGNNDPIAVAQQEDQRPEEDVGVRADRLRTHHRVNLLALKQVLGSRLAHDISDRH